MNIRRSYFETESGLPVGTHEPCKLESITRREPSEDNLKQWPDMKPSWCFMFTHCGNGDLVGKSAVRFCNESDSKLSHLYAFVTDLAGGVEPALARERVAGLTAVEVSQLDGQMAELPAGASTTNLLLIIIILILLL